MPERPVVPFERLWLDREFKKALRALPQSEQEAKLQEIESLIRALAVCRHPVTDPFLARWRPSPYHIGGLTGLHEYRCKYALRIIVRWIEPSSQDPAGLVLMVAATLTHDHTRLREIIARNKGEIRNWSE